MNRLASGAGKVCIPALLAAGALLAGGCGEQSAQTSATATVTVGTRTAAVAGAVTATATTTTPVAPRRRVPSGPQVNVPAHVGRGWHLVATVREAPAAWLAQRGGVTLMRFEQNVVHLALHAGSAEPGGHGWVHGAQIGSREVHRVIAGFNGGFKLSYGSVGFVADGRVAVALAPGLGSIVTYASGLTQIGAWDHGVPSRGQRISSVRQNLHLLVDHGVAAGNVEACVQQCWGSTLGGGTEVARSALGITRDGQLVWAAGTRLSPGALADALVAAGVQRAVELDINPAWVAGYLYEHHAGGPKAVPVVPGQVGIAGQLLEADARDFFVVLAD